MFFDHSMLHNRVLPLARTLAGRLTIGCLQISLFTLSLTPHCWPIYPLALVPLVWLWRSESLAIRSLYWLVVEAIALGSITVWLITRFVPTAIPLWGTTMHLVCCVLYSSLTLVIALSLQLTKSLTLPQAAAVTALAATVVEFLQARTLGVTWILSNPALAISATPIAQWSGVLTPFGLSAVLYWINFSWLPAYQQNDHRWRWTGTLNAFGMTAMLWLGGMFLESRVAVGSPPFSALRQQTELRVLSYKHFRGVLLLVD